MSDQKQGFDNKQGAPKSKPGAEQQGFSWKRLLAKKWVFPAVYVVAAAIIVTIVWGAYNKANDSANPASYDTISEQTGDSANESAITVGGKQESMKWPVKDRNEVEVVLPFYDVNASVEDRELATIEYGDTFIPNTGIGLARKDNQPFDVVAALSGKVTRIEKNPVVGNLVEIKHSNGLVTVYQSLQDIKVTQDAEVKQGQVIAKAGRNDLEKAQGVHLHFEIRQEATGQVLNPENYLGLQLGEKKQEEQGQTDQADQTGQTNQADPTGQSEQPEADETQAQD